MTEPWAECGKLYTVRARCPLCDRERDAPSFIPSDGSVVIKKCSRCLFKLEQKFAERAEQMLDRPRVGNVRNAAPPRRTLDQRDEAR